MNAKFADCPCAPANEQWEVLSTRERSKSVSVTYRCETCGEYASIHMPLDRQGADPDPDDDPAAGGTAGRGGD